MEFNHHYVFGETGDFLTGKKIPDTHDERLIQKLAKHLVVEKGYEKNDIRAHVEVTAKAGAKTTVVEIDFIVYIGGKACLLVKYGPGSIVTRHRPALSLSRLATGYQIPVVVVTNGIDADVLNGDDGLVVRSGLALIPDRKELEKVKEESKFKVISGKRVELEERILYSFEADGSCENNCMV